MIRPFKKKKDFYVLLDFITNNQDLDFYYTENNQRVFINDIPKLNNLLKQTSLVLVYEEKGEINGVILVWVSLGNEVKRYYLKVTAKNVEVASKLTKVLLWNWFNDLYVKFNKQNKYISMLRSNGFKFMGDRGREILIKRDKPPKIVPRKDMKNDSDRHSSTS